MSEHTKGRLYVDLDSLESAARSATPGPWAMEDSEVSDSAAPVAYVGSEIDAMGSPATGMRIMIQESHVWPNRQPRIGGFSWRQLAKKALANAAYVSAMNPSVTLNLIERLRASEALTQQQDALLGNKACATKECRELLAARALLREVYEEGNLDIGDQVSKELDNRIISYLDACDTLGSGND